MNSGWALFAGFFLLIGLVILAACLLLYILHSIGIMTLARNRGMANPWLVWIPVVGMYTVGALVDDINAREGQTTIFRWLLLGGNILSWISSGSSISDSIDIIMNPYYYSYGGYYGGGFSFFGGLLSLAFFVLHVIALNKIFKCYKPLSATTWTVLCVVPFTAFMQSIFPFVIRNNQPNWTNLPPGGYYPPGGGYDPYGQQGQQWQTPPQAPPQQGGWQQPPDDRQPPYHGQ